VPPRRVGRRSTVGRCWAARITGEQPRTRQVVGRRAPRRFRRFASSVAERFSRWQARRLHRHSGTLHRLTVYRLPDGLVHVGLARWYRADRAGSEARFRGAGRGAGAAPTAPSPRRRSGLVRQQPQSTGAAVGFALLRAPRAVRAARSRRTAANAWSTRALRESRCGTVGSSTCAPSMRSRVTSLISIAYIPDHLLSHESSVALVHWNRVCRAEHAAGRRPAGVRGVRCSEPAAVLDKADATSARQRQPSRDAAREPQAIRRGRRLRSSGR
jgi:hypothetical protein